MMIRVMLIDRSRIFAEALADRLDREPDMSVMAVKIAPEHPSLLGIDVVVCDDHLAGAVLESKDAWRPRPPHIVVLAERGRSGLSSDLIGRGAAGWVTRDSSSNHLIAAMRGVQRGETWVPPDLLTSIIAELITRRHHDRSVVHRLDTLTTREREILDLLGQGLDRSEVAARLQLSHNTVRTHVQNILHRLQVHSTLAAVAAGRRLEEAAPPVDAMSGTRTAVHYVR